MAESIERMLPNDINAEAAVLSAMMIDNNSVAKVLELVRENHFYKNSHKVIFRAISDLFERNIEVDIITLIHRLEEKSELEKIGGKLYINELSDIVLSSANVEFHAQIVLEKALLRDLITTSNQIIQSCYNPEGPINEIVDRAEQEIFKIAEMPNNRSFTKVSKIIPETLRNIEEVAKTRKSVLGVGSGFDGLDKVLGGFRKGQLVILAARPAMGKTSFALNIAFNAAIQDLKVGVFTLEMASDELLLRIFSSYSEVSMDSMIKGFGMDQTKIARISQVAEVLGTKDLFIDDTGSITVMDIRAKARRLKAEIKGLDLIIIDYLQLMTSKRNIDNRQQEIAEISRALKVLAKELEIPIIALSQLNRGLESRTDKRPMLSDLRESGAIEQDADIVMFIYRDDYYNKESEKPGIAEIIIGKNRHGATGSVDLLFQKEFTKFKDLEHNAF
ncbi:MAG TPA: replicative DNA helicase [Candidatus Cloacimonadota bacterium]|nr:replicative DNA helicase [Candidatus Cloacimonadota bacterium]HOD53499.1 replicative DNA helicase [Candidatus Cloacimonadota bacterium]HPM01962.1 replicative DNA helicase [Candidatus Cloacimonadota bacterium]